MLLFQPSALLVFMLLNQSFKLPPVISNKVSWEKVSSVIISLVSKGEMDRDSVGLVMQGCSSLKAALWRGDRAVLWHKGAACHSIKHVWKGQVPYSDSQHITTLKGFSSIKSHVNFKWVMPLSGVFLGELRLPWEGILPTCIMKAWQKMSCCSHALRPYDK